MWHVPGMEGVGQSQRQSKSSCPKIFLPLFTGIVAFAIATAPVLSQAQNPPDVVITLRPGPINPVVASKPTPQPQTNVVPMASPVRRVPGIVNFNNYDSNNPIFQCGGLTRFPVEGSFVQVLGGPRGGTLNVLTNTLGQHIFTFTEPGFFNAGFGVVPGVPENFVASFQVRVWRGAPDFASAPEIGSTTIYDQPTGSGLLSFPNPARSLMPSFSFLTCISGFQRPAARFVIIAVDPVTISYLPFEIRVANSRSYFTAPGALQHRQTKVLFLPFMRRLFMTWSDDEY